MNNLFNDVIKDIDKECLTNDTDSFATNVRILYDSLKRSGFTADQSMELVKECLRLSLMMNSQKGETK